MARLGTGVGRRRGLRAPASAPAPASPVGFAPNGSTNPKLRAMLARVRAGTGRGRIVFKGDSTTAGAGGGTAADANRCTNARPNRTSAVLASLLSASGTPALDNGVVGDSGMGRDGGVGLAPYDPRVSMGNPPWTVVRDQRFAGGALLQPASGGIWTFAPTTPVGAFEVVLYNNAAYGMAFAIDGSTAVTIALAGSPGGGASVSGNTVTVSGNTGGFTRVIVSAPSPGARVLGMAPASGSGGVVRSVMAYDPGASAIDILNHASNGGKVGDQGATDANRWRGGDALRFDAPDLTIVNLGLNDIAETTGTAAYADGLRAILAQARASGDALLVFPHPAGGRFAVDAVAYRDAAAALAAAEGVAFLSLFDHYGGAFTPALQARMADGLVHGDAGFYAEVADLYRRCVAAMAA